jgi:hypothetical protein
MVNQTKFPVPLIKAQLDASGITHTIMDSSTNSITPTHGGSYAEENVYTVSGSVDPSGNNVASYIETDTIEWDANHNIVYQHVEIDGDADLLNEINVFVTIINDTTYDPSNDDDEMAAITALVNKIECSKAEGMGTLAEYAALLDLAKDASHNINLTLDISGLEQFAAVAEEYGKVFQDITQNLTRVTTINSEAVLESIRVQLVKIADMYDSLGALKLEIQRTSTLQIPTSIQATADQLETVYQALECTLPYLEYFCGATGEAPSAAAQMNARDKAAIDAATGALKAYQALASGQATVTAENNIQVYNLKQKASQFANIKDRLDAAKTCLTNGLLFTGKTGLTFNSNQ